METETQPKKEIKTKVLIVDGIDGSGKDFFIDTIRKKLKNSISIRNNYRPKDAQDKEIIKQKYIGIFNVLRKIENFEYVILNRFYPSEMVYSKVKRDYNAMSDRWYDNFEKRLLNLNKKGIDVIFVYIWEEAGIIKSRILERGDDYILPEDVEKLLEGYEKVYKRSRLLKVKAKSSETDEIIKVIENGKYN